MKTVVIVGGGITGLSTAYFLHKQLSEQQRQARIILVEASQVLGGKIKTLRKQGFIMETGADSIVARKPNVAPLLQELGMSEDVVYNATGKSYIYSDGKLKLIPEDAVFGIPLSIESLAKSELVSAEGKVEALKDIYTKNETFTLDDSIGEFLESCFGKELVEKQIAPVLSGVYSGNLNDLTIASTLPYLLEYKNEYGSVIEGLSRNRQVFKGTGDRKFISFKDGVSDLIDVMEMRIKEDVEFIKGVSVEQLRRSQGQGVYMVSLSNGRNVECDYIVISAPHDAADAMLNDESLREDFSQMLGSSLISVYIGFDLSDQELPLDGTGFIVADSQDVICNACTWTSRKWEHTSTQNRLLVRLFYKSSGPHFERLSKLNESDMLDVALQDIQKSLGIQAKPVTYEVTPWINSMPNYHIKHHQLVQSLERKMEQLYPGVLLAGCSYYGVGIPDCIASGEKSAKWIAEMISK